MRRRATVVAWALAAGLGAAGCHAPSEAGNATGPNAPAPSAQAAVEVALNGLTTPGSVQESCGRGLFLSTRVTSRSSRPLQLQRLSVTFDSTSRGCETHAALIDPRLDQSLGPGRVEEVRVFDAAGELCEAPYGKPGCSWHATATVATDAGSISGSLDFVAEGATGRAGCAGVVPSVTWPRSGETVSKTVGVTASLAEGAGCNISARTLVSVYSERGVIVARSPPLDLGDTWPWDTTRLADGRYLLRAEQNCCRILSGPVEVTVRN